MATLQDALRYYQLDVSNNPDFNGYAQLFGDPPDDQSWWIGPDGQLTPQAQQWFAAAQNAGNQEKDRQAEADKDSKLGDFLKLGGLALGGYGLLSGLGGLGAAAGAGEAVAGAGLGDAALGGFYGGLGEGTAGAIGGLGGADSLVNLASDGLDDAINVDYSGMSNVDGGSQYADWASQGGGVDPGTTVFPGSGGDGSMLGKLGDWLGKVTPGQWLNLGGNVLGAGLNYFGASKAADAQEKAASDQQGLLKYMYDQNRADLAPWREAGVGALGNLVNLTTPGKQFDQMALDPGYQFRLSQGEQGINRAAASRGGYDSGGTLKALQRFGQDYASNEFGNVYNRNANLAGLGQTAVGQGVQAGQNYGQQAGESMLQAGNARASGYMGGANAIAGGIGSFLNNYNQQTLLDKLLAGKV